MNTRIRDFTPSRTGHDGFTLVEMMVALSLMAVAGLVVFSIFVSSQNSFYDTRQALQSQSDSRVVLSMLGQDIRSAGSDLQGGIQGLMFCDADSLRILSDLNVNGIIEAAAEPAEDVTWIYDATNDRLLRRTPTGQMVLVDDVQSFGIEYLDAAGNVIGPVPLAPADRVRVRAIRFDMTVEVDDHNTKTWSRTVALRNDVSL